jgi:hypothetical protein
MPSFCLLVAGVLDLQAGFPEAADPVQDALTASRGFVPVIGKVLSYDSVHPLLGPVFDIWTAHTFLTCLIKVLGLLAPVRFVKIEPICWNSIDVLSKQHFYRQHI